jgi:hypothetical protein
VTRVLAAQRARVVPGRSALGNREGAGKAGCALHPRSRVQYAEKLRTRAYRSSGEHPAFPAQWFDGLCRALPGDEFLLPPSLRRLAAKVDPVGHPSPPQSLTPATGARTTRFCRTQQRRSSCAGSIAHGFRRPATSLARNAIASTATRTPRIVTTRTPLFMRRDGARRAPFPGKVKRIIFDPQAGRPKSRWNGS